MERAVSIESLIDQSDIGSRQIVIVALCGLLAMTDGFDAQAIAFAAPEMVKEFAIPPAEFGAVFSAGAFGSLTGVVLQGPAGDRAGRKTVLLAACLIIAVASLSTTLVSTTQSLSLLRFITGVGLGGALPNLFALTSEYTPKRRRSTFVTAMFCGVPLGGVVGGFLAASFMSHWGWRPVFYLGGGAPLLLAVTAACLIPESVAFLAQRSDARPRIEAILARLGIEAPTGERLFHIKRSAPQPGVFAELFSRHHIAGTLLLSLISFLSLVVSISLTNWLPLILNQAGVAIGMAVIGGVALSGGGMLGALIFAALTDAYDVYRVLIPAYVAASVSVAAIGAAPLQSDIVIASIFAAGLLFIGAQMCIPTLVAAYYPSALHATGIGWTMGAGRIGAIVGPAFTGFLLDKKLAPDQLFYFAGAITVAATAALALLARLDGGQEARGR